MIKKVATTLSYQSGQSAVIILGIELDLACNGGSLGEYITIYICVCKLVPVKCRGHEDGL